MALLKTYIIKENLVFKVYVIPSEDQLEARVGYVIGHHYNSSESSSIMPMARDSEICCELELSDFGLFHMETLFDESLPVGDRSAVK